MFFLSFLSTNEIYCHLGKRNPKKRNRVITEQSLSGPFSKGHDSDAPTILWS